VGAVDPFCPGSYCHICKQLFKEGDVVCLRSREILFRFGKQRKKAKGNTHITLKVHENCNF
jgi:predicted nucleic acid-binding Zn ribbon protein